MSIEDVAAEPRVPVFVQHDLERLCIELRRLEWARELKEEAGIAVSDVRYLCSQPWPFPSSLMIGAHAMAHGESLTIDTNELDDARWFTRDEVVAALAGEASASFLPPPRSAIARTLLEHWVDGLK